METFILVLFFHVGIFGDTDSNAVTSIPRFATQQECEAAGARAKILVRGTKKEVEYVCLKQTTTES